MYSPLPYGGQNAIECEDLYMEYGNIPLPYDGQNAIECEDLYMEYGNLPITNS